MASLRFPMEFARTGRVADLTELTTSEIGQQEADQRPTYFLKDFLQVIIWIIDLHNLEAKDYYIAIHSFRLFYFDHIPS